MKNYYFVSFKRNGVCCTNIAHGELEDVKSHYMAIDDDKIISVGLATSYEAEVAKIAGVPLVECICKS